MIDLNDEIESTGCDMKTNSNVRVTVVAKKEMSSDNIRAHNV